MSEKTIRLLIDLTYDPDIMHGDDEEAIDWFNNILLGYNLYLGEFGELGDIIGSVGVVPHAADRIEALERENARLREALEDIERRSRPIPQGNTKWINDHARAAIQDKGEA